MAEPLKQLSILPNDFEGHKSKDIKKDINETHTEELIIALCGPVGTNIHQTTNTLIAILSDTYNYKCVEIRLSDIIRRYSKEMFSSDPNSSKEFNKIQSLINKGNSLRQKYGPSILAELAINEIAVNRENNKVADDYLSERVCYIIDSIKNKEELDLLRLIYRDIFHSIGVFSSIDNRVRFLEAKDMKTHEIYKLIDRDSGEEMQFGQKVSDTFVESDFFLRLDSESVKVVEQKLRRLLHLIFSSDVITPTIHETAMYLAFAAAGNSACLSRQVGASITDEKGEVISVGWNDVPKAGGGVYKIESDNLSDDKRCVNLENGVCFNDREKKKIANAVVDALIDAGIVIKEKENDALDALQNSRIKELIEFSRAVHAEMLAIILGGQKNGDKLINGRLYCTTYPCHNCARHIVAAGIKEVYYIEPYRKSMATKLHSDSITEDESKNNLVRILMYDGTAPRRYLNFFKMAPNSRKKGGEKISIPFKQISPKNTLSLQAIPYLEGMVTDDLKTKQVIHV